MPTAIITGSGGLIGSEAVSHFVGGRLRRHRDRQRHAGPLLRCGGLDGAHMTAPERYPELRVGRRHPRRRGIDRLFARPGRVELVIHTAAQPSHDWAARDPRPISPSTPTARSTCSRPRGGTAPDAASSSLDEQGLRRHARTGCRWWSRRRAGRSTGAHRYARRHRRDDVDRPLARIAVRRLARWPPTCWCRSTAATSACRPRASAAAA